MEALSPELALVDAELAAGARAALAPAPDVFAALARTRSNRDVVRRLRDSFNEQEALATAVAAQRSGPGKRRRLAASAFASTVAVGAVVTGVLALGRDDTSEPRAVAPTDSEHVHAPGPARATRHRAAPRRSVGAAVSQLSEPAAKPSPSSTPRPAAPARRPAPKVKPRLVVSSPKRKRAHTFVRPAGRKPQAAATPVMRAGASPVLSWPLARQATYYRVRVYRVTGQFLFEVWSDKTRLAVPETWKSGGAQNRLAPGRYGWAVYPAFGGLGEPSHDPAAGTPLAGGHFTV